MGLYLTDDELEPVLLQGKLKEPDNTFAYEHQVSRAAADHAAEEVVKMYELWHRGLSDTVAMEQFQIVYKVPYRLNFATCLELWLQEKKR